MTEKTYRRWAFTLNNYTDDDIENLNNVDCKYLIFGKELAPTTNTPHLQGYIVFQNPLRLSGVHEICKRMHWTACKGSHEQNVDYCSKSDAAPYIKDLREQGKRTDIDNAVITLKEQGLLGVINEHPREFVKFHSGFSKLAAYHVKHRDPDHPPTIYWYWGISGSGKTRSVFEAEKDLYVSGRDLKWWDGYENQEAVLIDDFRKDFCTYHELLRIIDRFPYTVQVKGGSRILNSPRIYITSCYHPAAVYDTREDLTQLTRRITHVKRFGEPNVFDMVEYGSDTEVD